MKIHKLYQQKKIVLSLELFPPKKNDRIETIYQTVEQLDGFQPDFISVTYGAGGEGNVDKTLEIARKIKDSYKIETLHHLSCINSKKSDIQERLDQIAAAGIENILALRGDIPTNEKLIENDYLYAKELIKEIKSTHSFDVGATCYPEGHIDQLDGIENITHLKEKQEAGAKFFISQLFFDNDFFYRLLDSARRAGIDIPISAGLMPILSRSQVEKMIFMCGVSLPSGLIKIIHRYGHSSEDLKKAGLDYAMVQMKDLVAHGVDGIHLYTMNQAHIAQTAMNKFRFK